LLVAAQRAWPLQRKLKEDRIFQKIPMTIAMLEFH
jgi:hypothetical protein